MTELHVPPETRTYFILASNLTFGLPCLANAKGKEEEEDSTHDSEGCVENFGGANYVRDMSRQPIAIVKWALSSIALWFKVPLFGTFRNEDINICQNSRRSSFSLIRRCGFCPSLIVDVSLQIKPISTLGTQAISNV